MTCEQADRHWPELEQESGLDFWEIELIQAFLVEGWYGPVAAMNEEERKDKESDCVK